MENVWVLAAIWIGLALLATLFAIRFRISTALTEIVVSEDRAGLGFRKSFALCPLSGFVGEQ